MRKLFAGKISQYQKACKADKVKWMKIGTTK